jgi:hypothetical protein
VNVAEKQADCSWRRWAPAAASAALALGLYAVTLWGTYIYDDVYMIQEDPRVAQPKLWGEFWTRDYFRGGLDNLYRPLVSQSYGLQWRLIGNRPWTFHLVNLLLHAGVSALVAELGRRLVNWRVGLIAGLLFAAHPIHSEVVAGIVGRAELACTIGIVGAMVLFLYRPMTQKRALAIGALGVVAMLSKEQGLLMPALLGVLYPVRREQQKESPISQPQDREAHRQAMLLVFALVFWATVGLIVLREEVLKLKFWWDRGFLDYVMQPLARSHNPDRWLMPVALVGRYLQMLIAPIKLSIDYGLQVIQPTISLSDPYLWLGAATLIAWLIITTAALVCRRWVTLFCLLAIAITFSMVLNVVELIEVIFAERLAYLPSVFFLILVAMPLARLPAKVWGSLLTLLLILACVRTFSYVRQWNDRPAFYEYSLREQPKSLKLYLLAAFEEQQAGRFDEARQTMRRAEAMDPNYSEFWRMSAIIDQNAGDWDMAVTDWKRAFDLQPSQAFAFSVEQAMQMREKARAATRP